MQKGTNKAEGKHVCVIYDEHEYMDMWTIKLLTLPTLPSPTYLFSPAGIVNRLGSSLQHSFPMQRENAYMEASTDRKARKQNLWPQLKDEMESSAHKSGTMMVKSRHKLVIRTPFKPVINS